MLSTAEFCCELLNLQKLERATVVTLRLNTTYISCALDRAAYCSCMYG